jgi:hypothetical protein
LLEASIEPSISQRIDISECLESLEDQLYLLGSKATEAAGALDQFHAEEGRYEGLIRKHQSVLSSFRFLPAEILAEIFAFATTEGVDVVDRSGTPWSVTSVCRQWRSIALSCRLLWSHISSITNDTFTEDHLAILHTTLHRSGSTDLGFSFGYTSKAWPRSYMNAFAIVATHHSRWRNVHIDCIEPMIPVINSLRGKLPRLHRVSISWRWHPSSQISIGGCIAFDDCPELREVSEIGEVCPVLSLPWPQLLKYN